MKYLRAASLLLLAAGFGLVAAYAIPPAALALWATVHGLAVIGFDVITWWPWGVAGTLIGVGLALRLIVDFLEWEPPDDPTVPCHYCNREAIDRDWNSRRTKYVPVCEEHYKPDY